MKKFLFLVLLAIVSISFGQRPNLSGLYDNGTPWPDGDPGSPEYCSTAETIEDCTNSWVWNSNFQDCIQPGYEFCEALFGTVWILDTWECCCQVASLPGSEAVWTGFMESSCPAYLDSIGFIYDDPDYINWTSLNESDIELDGIYIDMYGIQHTIPPKGLSIMNKQKYMRL